MNDIMEAILCGSRVLLHNGSRSPVFNAKLFDVEVPFEALRETRDIHAMGFTLGVGTRWDRSRLTTTRDGKPAVKLSTSKGSVMVDQEALTSKSDVFQDMFHHDTKERQTGVVKIVDHSLVVLTEMARFVVHDYCSGWTKHYDQLLAIADKYNIEGMKKLAEKKVLMDEAKERK